MNKAHKIFFLSFLVLILHACNTKPKSAFESLSETDKQKALEMLRAKRDSIDEGTDVGNALLCTYDRYEVPIMQMLDSALNLGANVNCDCYFQGKRVKTGVKIPVVKKFIKEKVIDLNV